MFSYFLFFFFFFFFNDTATTEIYTLSLHDALPISPDAPPHHFYPPVMPVCPELPPRTHPESPTPLPRESTSAARPEAMPVAWEYRPPADRLLQFDGVIDASGNLYWSECGAFHSCDVVSVDHEGRV